MANSNNDEFKILSPRDHILSRSGMYIGSTSLEKIDGIFMGEYTSLNVIPGLLKIINEILDNSIDEYIRTNGKHANKITVSIDEHEGEPLITISDNGRGIPIEEISVVQDDGNGDSAPSTEYRPVIAWTKAMAGTNFTDERTTMGANGVGSFCTNVFSNKFVGTTCDGKQKLILTCHDNGLVDSIKINKGSTKGTSVSFVPDMSRFGDGHFTEDHYTAIKDRLENLAFSFPNLTFKFNKETIKCDSLKSFADKFGTNVSLNIEDKGAIVIANSGDDQEFRLLSYVNGLYLKNGGTHVDYLLSKLIEELRPMIKRKHSVDVLPNQIKQHLMFVNIFRDMKNLKFDGQTKERLTNNKAEIENYFGDIDFKKIARNIMGTEDIIEPIVHSHVMKLKEKERREKDKLARDNAKNNVSKHVSPNNKKDSGNVLYIVEGDSAKSNFLQTRERGTQGIYPLRGKFLNTQRASDTDILKNQSASDIMNVLGLKLGKKAPDELNFGYDRIYITSDADIDGYCITAQVINFLKLWPELFERGIVYIVRTPIMVSIKNNKVNSIFYTLDDYSNAKLDNNEKIKYLKGLGTLTIAQYREYVTMNPKIERVVLDENSNEYLNVAFSDNIQKRKEWLYI